MSLTYVFVSAIYDLAILISKLVSGPCFPRKNAREQTDSSDHICGERCAQAKAGGAAREAQSSHTAICSRLKSPADCNGDGYERHGCRAHHQAVYVRWRCSAGAPIARAANWKQADGRTSAGNSELHLWQRQGHTEGKAVETSARRCASCFCIWLHSRPKQYMKLGHPKV